MKEIAEGNSLCLDGVQKTDKKLARSWYEGSLDIESRISK